MLTVLAIALASVVGVLLWNVVASLFKKDDSDKLEK